MPMVRDRREGSISLVFVITCRGYVLAVRKISAKEVVSDIGAGLSNEEIGEKYNLSERDTRRLLDKLLSANMLVREEHDRRIARLVQTTDSGDGNGRHAVCRQVVTTPPETPLARTQLLERLDRDDKAATVDSGGQFESVQPEPYSDPRQKDIPSEAVSTPAEFIDVSEKGENQWWRYVVSILFMLFFSGAIPGMIAVIWGLHPDRSTGGFVGLDPFGNYVLMHVGIVGYLVTFLLAVRFEHKRSILSLITPERSIDWKKLGKSFGIFSGLLFLVLIMDYLMFPETLHFSFNPGRFLYFAPVVIILTPIQTTTEELFFRGYLLQMMALLTRNRFILILVSGVLFMLPHLVNPEVALGPVPVALQYFAIGVFLTFITLESNGLEVAMGIHAATNLFLALVVNYETSALQTESIFRSSELDPIGSLVSFCITALVFYGLMFRKVPIFSRITNRFRSPARG